MSSTTSSATSATTTNGSSTTITNMSKPIRIWVDGCFDMFHYGHANVLRQARALGDYLVVGVHNDLDITANKGIPVTKEEERYAAVSACKWVDMVVPNAPYVTSLEIMDKYDCQYCVHGDDLVLSASGTDCYEAVKKANRFWMCKRTPSVSTTDIVGRMLLRTKDHHYNNSKAMLPTSSRIIQFSNGIHQPRENQKVVYVDGAFDILHQGHFEFLKKAKGEEDNFVIVGIHDDFCVNEHKGLNLPIMNLHERALSLLACRWVDEIILGAPWAPTIELIKGASGYPIDRVCHGKTSLVSNGGDPYIIPKKLGIYEEIDSCFPDISSNDLINRIMERRSEYETRNEKKKASMPEGLI